MYRKVYINGEETYFRIYDDGRLMSEKTGSFYKGTVRNGYLSFDLNWKGKRYSRSQHRLVAEAFIPNPNNLPYVHHINNNRLDNSIENLQWVSISENNLKKNKKPSGKDHTDYQEYDLNIEEWKPFRDTRYLVSNLGRVKNKETNKISKGKITDAGYREYCLTYDKRKHSHFGHKLVWEVWVGDKQDIINHINGNKLDNRLCNLENVSNQENVMKAIYDTKTLKFQKTACYDKEGKLVKIYLNNADAARDMGIKPASIWSAIHKGYCSCGYYWKNIDEV